jgi:hypothetical protein
MFFFGGIFLHHGDKKNGCANTTKEIKFISSRIHVFKDPSNHLLDQWWMQNNVFTDLFTHWIAKPYPLSSLYHNCIMFQLATIANNTPNFQWLIVKSNVNYVQDSITNITTWILCMG